VSIDVTLEGQLLLFAIDPLRTFAPLTFVPRVQDKQLRLFIPTPRQHLSSQHCLFY
jgi:hypothetical protein